MESNNNHTLRKIFDEIAIEDTQGLIRKDLLLDFPTEDEKEQREAMEQYKAEQEASRQIAIENGDLPLEGIEEREWREECNPSLLEIHKNNQLKRHLQEVN